MSRPSHVFRWSRLLPMTFGSLAIVGLLLVSSAPGVAQTKKDAKATSKAKDAKDAKESEDPKEKIEVKYVPMIPAVTDRMVTTTGVAQVAKINEAIKANWLANKVNPSDRCTDYEFIRRASLDLIGRIATEKEITEYLRQPEPTRRSWLVEKLLANPEFGENFANIWTVMLLTRTNSKKMYQEQMREWLTEQFNEKEADWSKTANALITASGKTNENAAVNFVAHHIGEEIRQDESKKGRASAEEMRESGKYDMVPVTSRTTRLFLGIRTQCVQCHDHPFNGELQQGQFWGVNAFFRQTTVSARPPVMQANKKNKKMGEDPQIELHDDPTFNEKGIVSYERRSGLLKYTSVQFIDGTRVKNISQGSSRRAELAKLIVANPSFSKVFVNRTWAHFFGKSFTKDSVDDFGEHNPCTNPELLDYLAEQFKTYKHNPKDLMRWICNSQAYGLSSKANKTNDKPDDEVLFARMLLKSMSPEQLFDSLMTATARGLSKEARHEAKSKWLDQLVLNFGNDEGEEGTFTGTVVQALMLMNGSEINDAITDQKGGTVQQVIKQYKIGPAAITKLYLASLNRPPSASELQRLLDPKMYLFFNPALKGRINPGTEQFATAYFQDVFWALLNSNEFILNH